MKTMISLLLLVSIYQPVTAQFKTIAEGPEFAEYREGYSKVLQLKNGNTILLHFSIKLGINVQLYDQAHQRIQDQHIEPSYGKLRGGDFDAIFESQGDVVVLFSERTERHPILRRLIFDGKAGKLKKEDVLVDLDRETKAGKRYREGSSSDFNVVKDPYSECYAVMTEKNGEGSEVIHYGADHTVISRADLPMESLKKKYEMIYEDMVVKGNEGVYVLLTEEEGNDYNSLGELQLASLEKGGKAYQLSALPFPKNEDIKGAVLRYNPQANQLYMLQYLKRAVKKKSTFHTFFAAYNPATKEASAAKELSMQTVNTKSKVVLGEKYAYEGIPQNLYIQPDGSFLVVFEETELIYHQSQSNRLSASTTFGNLAVMNYDRNGTEKNCWMIPRKVFVAAMTFNPFYHKKREYTAEWNEMGNQYRFFNLVSSTSHNYIVVNDRNDNSQFMKDGKVKQVGGVSDCYGYYYKLEGEEIFPKRTFIFTSPEAERFNNIGIFISAGQGINSFATIRVAPRDQKKARLVWLTPE